MNIKNNISKYVAASVSVLALAGSVAVGSASAQVSASVSANAGVSSAAVMPVVASTSVRAIMRERMGSSTMRMSSTTREQMRDQRQDQAIGDIQDHSNTEITARIDSLNTLLGKVNAMTRLTSAEKTTITGEVDNLIADLTNLQAKIAVDASSTPIGQQGALSSSSPIRIDMESITKDYRVYALVIPQVEILAAADRAQTLVASLTTLSAKLQTRITAAQTAGENVTALQASLADLNAKTADTQTQASAAVTATASLTPDNGDTTTAASNDSALKSARTDIQTADSDTKAASADAQSIVKAVEAMDGKTSASASVTQ